MDSKRVIDVFPRPDITRPRWDQNTYQGRALHFFTTINPLNAFALPSTLENCKTIVQGYKKGEIEPSLTVGQLWKAKHLYDSAFHPDSGNLMFLTGRMSFQVWGNMLLTGGMLAFYRQFHHVVFWNWLNQSFNAQVNYTNRSGPHAASNERLLFSYICATGAAVGSALYLNSLVKDGNSFKGRLVPFAAVAVANAVNIPIMRSTEFVKGIPVEDRDGQVLGESKRVPKIAVPQVVLSRIGMAVPSFVGIPLIMNVITKKKWYHARPWLGVPIQTALAGLCLVFSTPLCCALFPQKSSIKVSLLEPELQAYIRSRPNPPDVVYYNKGL
ncbi:unnamed protein product, partial [Mesorhabditis spiculigera]